MDNLINDTFTISKASTRVALPALEIRIKVSYDLRNALSFYWNQRNNVASAYLRGAFDAFPSPSTRPAWERVTISNTLSELAWLCHVLEFREDK